MPALPRQELMKDVNMATPKIQLGPMSFIRATYKIVGKELQKYTWHKDSYITKAQLDMYNHL